MNKLFITLKDIGYYRIFLRIKYEIRRKIDSYLNVFFLKKLYLSDNNITEWKLNNLKIKNSSLNKIYNKSRIYNYEFIFLNDKKILNDPIDLNNRGWNRLWQFNLHYFDWVRKL